MCSSDLIKYQLRLLYKVVRLCFCLLINQVQPPYFTNYTSFHIRKWRMIPLSVTPLQHIAPHKNVCCSEIPLNRASSMHALWLKVDCLLYGTMTVYPKYKCALISSRSMFVIACIGTTFLHVKTHISFYGNGAPYLVSHCSKPYAAPSNLPSQLGWKLLKPIDYIVEYIKSQLKMTNNRPRPTCFSN